MSRALNDNGVDADIFWIGNKALSGCIACKKCQGTGKCVFNDSVNEFLEISGDYDGFVFGTPVHWAGATGAMTSFMDRAFYAAGTFGQLYKGKCAAAVVCRYRSGGSAALDRLNKYITTSQMNLIGSIDYMEFHSDFSEETGRFDTKVLKKLADQMVQALSVQE